MRLEYFARIVIRQCCATSEPFFSFGAEGGTVEIETDDFLEPRLLVGPVAAGAAFGILALLFDTLRPPILRLIVALVFAAPVAVAGYALVHGATKESVPSEIWRQIWPAYLQQHRRDCSWIEDTGY